MFTYSLINGVNIFFKKKDDKKTFQSFNLKCKPVSSILVSRIHSVPISAAGADCTTGGFRQERDGKPGRSH